MQIFAIDPGPEQSAYVVWDGAMVRDHGILLNGEIRTLFLLRHQFPLSTHCAIEMIASYGMAVGAEVFGTCVWIGRFIEQWISYAGSGEAILIPRLDVKVHLCKSARAKDANIRQALIDRFGGTGTKKKPGPLFGISSHKWAALAVAVTVHDRLKCGHYPEVVNG